MNRSKSRNKAETSRREQENSEWIVKWEWTAQSILLNMPYTPMGILLLYDFSHPMDCSPLVSSVHGISQARTLECVAISFSNFIIIFFYHISIFIEVI